MAIPIDHEPPEVRVGYLGTEATKAPNWHGLVTLDLLLNNGTTGLFLVAAVGELARPGLLGPVARLAFPIALGLRSSPCSWAASPGATPSSCCRTASARTPRPRRPEPRTARRQPLRRATWCRQAGNRLSVACAPIRLFSTCERATATAAVGGPGVFRGRGVMTARDGGGGGSR